MTQQNTKKCPTCNWVYPITHPDLRCRFCGTVFLKRFCSVCGEYKLMKTALSWCHKCESKRVMRIRTKEENRERSLRHTAKVLAQREIYFTEWLNEISKVPQPLVTLTEKEWIDACNHFNCCAVCDNESIDARAFFVPFAYGGRYAAWNVIPVCEKCATALRRRSNPFVKYAEAAPRIVEYLAPILERTIVNDKNF